MTAEIGKLTITYDLDDSGDTVTNVIVDGDIPLSVQLGLLRLAEDSLLREAVAE